MKNLLKLVFIALISLNTYCQSVTIDPSNSNTLLEVSSESKGVIFSRMTTAQRKSIVNPKTGTLVFDTDKTRHYLFDGQFWLALKLEEESGIVLNERKPLNSSSNSNFGQDVSIDGNLAAIGAPKEIINGVEKGAVYIFEKTVEGWKQRAKITANDGNANDLFGSSVALKGDSLFIGAKNAANTNNSVKGAVYFFRYISTTIQNQGTVKFWFQSSKLQSTDNVLQVHNNFGSTIAFNNYDLFIGAASNDVGATYWYEKVNQDWVFRTVLYSPNSHSYDYYGGGISLSGDYVAIAAFQSNSPSNSETIVGAVFIYVKGGGTWTLQKTLRGTNSFDFYGASVALDNNLLVIGVPGSNQSTGFVDFYIRSGSNWNYTDYFEPSNYGDWYNNNSPYYQTQFGSNVFIKNGFMIIGSFIKKASIFKYENNRWRLIDHISYDISQYYFPKASISGNNLIVSGLQRVFFANLE